VDWKAKVDLFEQVRREHEFGIGTIAGVAAKFGVHRRVVRQALAGAVPPRHHYPERSKPRLGAVEAFIDQVLAEDRRTPRKQRHTARRIHQRILREFPDAAVAESTVRNHVRARKRQMGLDKRETFVPQDYVFGQEAQVDWYEAWVDFAGERTKVQVFAMRAMASGAAFHRGYLHATQQAFLEAHEHPFAYFGGVFHTLRYDNLASAMRKILRGHRRERPPGSWRSARTGGLPPNSARRARGMRREASRAKAATSGATTWCRCRRWPTSMRSMRCC
jgi:transposase